MSTATVSPQASESGPGARLRHILIGTAGHIDHGKTRLVGRLTGIDTDRLPEEKARGISIDLGFAHWESDGFQFGVVDVPGHERFVKNMVAGATGINLALLVIAADDGVMPQTREHLDIMDLLGVKTGLVAISKIDLVEPDFVELVQAEVEELVEGTFLEGCPIVPVSSETGEGIDALRAEILRLAAAAEFPELHDVFRMPIDRVFSIPGHGAVVTGSVLSGEVRSGDTLVLLPDEREVRVRSVQHHGIQSADAGARQRTAVNVAGLKHEELHRGQELATPGYLHPTRRLLVELRSLAGCPLTLKDRMELGLHVGTNEAPARIIFKGRVLRPGERAFAELRVKEPVVAAWGQRFILRRTSPALTVAGGTVLDPHVAPDKRIRDLEAYGTALASPSEMERLSFLLRQQDTVENSPLEAAWRAGIPRQRYAELIETLRAEGDLVTVGPRERRLLLHRGRLEGVSASVMRTVRAELARHQPRRALPRNTLLTACRRIARPELLDAVFTHLLQTRQLVAVGDNLGPADAQVKLTKNQEQARSRILREITDAGLAPPTLKELGAALGMKPDQVQPLLHLCAEDGLLVKIDESLYFAPQALERARAICEETLREGARATMSELREAWGVSRKFAVPLCEYFDNQGVTLRQDDLRAAGPKIGETIN